MSFVFELEEAEFSKLATSYTHVPLIRSYPMGTLTPQKLLQKLSDTQQLDSRKFQTPNNRKFPDTQQQMLLESTRTHEELGRYSFLPIKPDFVFKAKGEDIYLNDTHSQGDPTHVLRELLRTYTAPQLEGAPLFCNGAMGFFSYEASHYFDEAMPLHSHDDLNIWDIYLWFVSQVIVFDHVASVIHLIASGKDFHLCTEQISQLENLLISEEVSLPTSTKKEQAIQARETTLKRDEHSLQEYVKKIRHIQDYIKSGETYQVNLSQRLETPFDFPSLDLYAILSELNPVPFASFIQDDDFAIVSASPERLVCTKNNHAFTRPIAGTRRTGSPEEEAKFIEELHTDPKENAEHAMLVDLGRNDLGKVCTYGSVRVHKLMEVIRYQDVLHIESEIMGELRPSVDPLDIFAALFPGGTITGAPKIRTMEIIRELEPHTRGLYTGSIGYFSFNGCLDFNIVIRTIVCKNKKAHIQVGGGIVLDSIPEREYEETLHKARSLVKSLELTSTRGTSHAVPLARTYEPQKILVIDNYDSFTYNLVQLLGRFTPHVTVMRHDKKLLPAIYALKPTHLVISPGPCSPKEAGISCDLIRHYAGKIPILGICLGHQCIGDVFGGTITRAEKPLHGQFSWVTHSGTDLFAGAPHPMKVGRYHSLVIDPNSLPSCLEITASCDNLIMGVKHRTIPHVYGVQFHPESFLSEGGEILIENFLNLPVMR